MLMIDMVLGHVCLSKGRKSGNMYQYLCTLLIIFSYHFSYLQILSVCTIPDTQANELEPFIASLKSVPKSGVHNPLKNNERYLQFGEISRKVRRYDMI